MKKVLICLPTHSTIESSTIKSLWDMEVPKEEELVTIHNYLVQPILSFSNSSLLSEFEESGTGR